MLGYTQSAVSQQLAALERQVGEPLVDRSQRPLRATAAGLGLKVHVDRLLAAAAAIEAAVANLSGGATRLRLAAFTSALSSFVPRAVRDLRRLHPALEIQVAQLETREAIESLRAGEADLALVHYLPGAALPDRGGLERRGLLVDDLYIVLPEGHRLARQEEVRIAEIKDEPLILPRRDTPAGRFRSLVEHLCAGVGFTPRVAYELDDLPAAQAFVAAGIALVPMHGLMLGALPPGSTARPLADRPEGSRTIEALVPRSDRAPVVDDLLNHLGQAAADYMLAR